MAEQSPLPFGPRRLPPSRYRPSPGQLEAAEQLTRHGARMAKAQAGLTAIYLYGPAGSGKSRFVAEWEAELRTDVLVLGEASPLEAFAAVNAAAAARSLLVLEARVPLSRIGEVWAVPIAPDVTSRLSSLPQWALDRPPLETVQQVLADELKLHGQHLAETDLAWVAAHLPRDFRAPRRFCETLDRAPAKNTRRELLQWTVEKVHVAAP